MTISWTDQSNDTCMPWLILHAVGSSRFTLGIDYEMRVQHVNAMCISDETARCPQVYTSQISTP